jgi:hippurate hydrolase
MPSIRACASSGLQPRIESMSDFIREFMSPVEHIRADHAELTAMRRDLHAHPELGFEEHRTAEIGARVTALGIEHHPVSRPGVVTGIQRAPRQRRAIGLRAT